MDESASEVRTAAVYRHGGNGRILARRFQGFQATPNRIKLSSLDLDGSYFL